MVSSKLQNPIQHKESLWVFYVPAIVLEVGLVGGDCGKGCDSRQGHQYPEELNV